MTETLGIDVYEGDGAVDWASVKQHGYRFGIVKATEGATIRDSAFKSHWAEMKAAGLVRGAYHFLHIGTSSPIDQAENFLRQLGPLEAGDLPPVLDIEVANGRSGGEVKEAAIQWAQHVENTLSKSTGKCIRPIIYAAAGFWDEIGNPDLSKYPLWVANYTSRPTPEVPDCWDGAWLMHQYAGDVGCAGVESKADISRWNPIQLGNKSKLVADVQQRLVWHGYKVGIDGVFGQGTKEAIALFQKAKQLTPNGIVCMDTWLKLIWG